MGGVQRCALACGLVVLASVATAKAAAPVLRNDQIEIAYVEPTNPDFEPLYEGLKARKVLEELRAFLAPLKLPRTITVKVDQCGELAKVYKPGEPVTICYEYVAKLRELAQKLPTESADENALTRDDAIVGAFVQAVLQRTASAVFDVLDTPIWGREEDAADKLAAFLMLQFGPKAARKLIDGATYFFNASDQKWTGVDFSELESTQSQRYYNYVCMALGADPTLFADFDASQAMHVDKSGHLPKLGSYRASWCPREYSEEVWAFQQLILPHIDLDLMRQVLARDWLAPFTE